MKNTTTILIVIGAAIVLGAGFVLLPRGGTGEGGAGTESTPAPSSLGTLERLENIPLSDYDGNQTTLADFIGTPLVLNSWATWCPFCRQELPDFARLQEELGENAIVIAIDRAEKVAQAKRYTDDFGISSKMVFLMDFDDAFYRNIGGFSMPETLFVNAEGNIVFHKRGPMTLEEMRSLAEQYLK